MRRTAQDTARQAVIAVKVVPRASHSRLEGWQGETLKVRVQAPPVEGKANAALIALLAQALGIARGKLDIVRGESARTKWVRVSGLSADELTERLKAFMDRPA